VLNVGGGVAGDVSRVDAVAAAGDHQEGGADLPEAILRSKAFSARAKATMSAGSLGRRRGSSSHISAPEEVPLLVR
jgi:hypothetical protein